MDEKHNHRLHNTEEKTASGRMSTYSHFKMKILRSLVVLIACLALYITASSVAHATSASITISRSSTPTTTQVTVSGTGFGVREMITISVDLPGKHLNPDKRYHDWLRPATS